MIGPDKSHNTRIDYLRDVASKFHSSSPRCTTKVMTTKISAMNALTRSTKMVAAVAHAFVDIAIKRKGMYKIVAFEMSEEV